MANNFVRTLRWTLQSSFYGIPLTRSMTSAWYLSSKSSAFCSSAPSATGQSRINTEPNDASSSYCDTIVAFNCMIIWCKWMRLVVWGGWLALFILRCQISTKAISSSKRPPMQSKRSLQHDGSSGTTRFMPNFVLRHVGRIKRPNIHEVQLGCIYDWPEFLYCSTKRICYAVQGLPLFILKTRHDCLHVAQTVCSSSTQFSPSMPKISPLVLTTTRTTLRFIT